MRGRLPPYAIAEGAIVSRTARIARGHMIVAFPGEVGTCLASGVADLNARYGSCSFDRLDHRRKRLGMRIAPQTRAAGSDAPFWRDRSCLGNDQARTATREGGEMDVMPVIGQAVVRRILAHGRDGDAIFELNSLQGERLEQGSHDGFFLE